jgi:hypothetical protein
VNRLAVVTQCGQTGTNKSKWVRCQDPWFADKETRELAESFIVCKETSVHGFREYYMNM